MRPGVKVNGNSGLVYYLGHWFWRATPRTKNRFLPHGGPYWRWGESLHQQQVEAARA